MEEREPELLRIRRQMEATTGATTLGETHIRALLQHIKPRLDLLEKLIREGIESSFSRTVEINKTDSPLTPSYLLALYLSYLPTLAFENKSIKLSRGDDADKLLAASLLDMNSGFKHIVYPLMIAHRDLAGFSSEVKTIAKEFDISISPSQLGNGMEMTGEWKVALHEDKSGFRLIDRQLKVIREGEVVRPFQVREFVLAGGEFASRVYREHYPTAEKIVNSRQT